MLLVEQNADIALSIPNYGYVLETGEVILSGEADHLLSEEKVERAYFGLRGQNTKDY
jgi:branched-chain amino acid transport system ATP-binding protein